MAAAVVAANGVRSWRGRVAVGMLAAACGLSLAAPAAGESQVLPTEARCSLADPGGVRHCEVGWTEDRMRNLWQPQALSNWCWAAAVSMLFSATGKVMSQPEIVAEQYGAVVNEPEHMAHILDLLDRTWSDPQGRRFRFATELVGRDVDLRSLAEPLLADLERGRPWLIFHARHVVLLARIDVEVGPRDPRPRIVGGTVLDPNPGEGVRPLRAQEWVPRYAVRVRVIAEDD